MEFGKGETVAIHVSEDTFALTSDMWEPVGDAYCKGHMPCDQ
jgi:hypothetical protein